MNEAIQYMDIIFLAVVAGIVLLRLRSILGKRTGSEKKDPNLYSYDQPVNQSPDITKPKKVTKQTKRHLVPARQSARAGAPGGASFLGREE